MEGDKFMTKTSIQYQLSNNVLFNEVFGHWSEFSNVLRQGPDEMKKYLYEKWNYICSAKSFLPIHRDWRKRRF